MYTFVNINNKFNPIMKTIKDLKLDGNYGINLHKPGSHCSIAMWNGFFVPCTKAQYNKWMKATDGWGDYSSVIGSMGQVIQIDNFMKKHGFEAKFKYTKSGTFVRLINFNEFKKACKTELEGACDFSIFKF